MDLEFLPTIVPVWLCPLNGCPAIPIQTVCYRRIKSINVKSAEKNINNTFLVGDHGEPQNLTSLSVNGAYQTNSLPSQLTMLPILAKLVLCAEDAK